MLCSALRAPRPLPPLDPAVPGCGSALENVSADNEREGWGVSEVGGPASVTPILCVSAGSTEGPDTLGGTVQWGASPSSTPARTNTYSEFPESAVTPRSPPRGCAEPGPGGKALTHALGRGPDLGSVHLGGDSHAVGVFVLVTGTFHDGFSSNLSPVCVVLRLKGKFLGVKFCLANLKLNLPLLVFLS